MPRNDSPYQRNFRGRSCVGRGVDSRCWAKICAWELSSVASRGLPPLNTPIQNSKFGRGCGQLLNFDFASYHAFYDLPKFKIVRGSV